MPPNTSTDHNPGHLESAALYALGVMDSPAEVREFERHLEQCPACQETVERDRDVARQLAAAAPEIEISAALRARVLASAAASASGGEAEHEAQPDPPVSILRARRLRPRPFGRLFALAAALALVLAAGLVANQQATVSSQNAIVASAPLTGSVAAGSAHLLTHRSGARSLELRGLPEPAAGEAYAAWLLLPDGSPLLVGTTEQGSATVPFPNPLDGQALALTLEPKPVGPAPATAPILSLPLPA